MEKLKEKINLLQWQDGAVALIKSLAQNLNKKIGDQSAAIQALQKNMQGIQDTLGTGAPVLQLKPSQDIVPLRNSAGISNVNPYSITDLTSALIIANVISSADGRYLVQNCTQKDYFVIMIDGSKSIWTDGEVITLTRASISGSTTTNISIDYAEQAIASFDAVPNTFGLFAPLPEVEDLFV